MPLPGDLQAHIAHVLAENIYTSVSTVMEESAESLLALPGMESLKPGAKTAFKVHLKGLKVSAVQAYYECAGNLQSIIRREHMLSAHHDHTGITSVV